MRKAISAGAIGVVALGLILGGAPSAMADTGFQGVYATRDDCINAGIEGIIGSDWGDFSCDPYHIGWSTLWGLTTWWDS